MNVIFGKNSTNKTLNILVGDSIDRDIVTSQCKFPINYFKNCSKCMFCETDKNNWLNVMHFGLQLNGCVHKDPVWRDNEDITIEERFVKILNPIIYSEYIKIYKKVNIIFNSGLWDIATFKECPMNSNLLYNSSWDEQLYERILKPFLHRPFNIWWRNMPLTCRLFDKKKHDYVYKIVSDKGKNVATKNNIKILDLRSLSFRMKRYFLLPDGIHWNNDANKMFGKIIDSGQKVNFEKCDFCNNSYGSWSFKIKS